MPVMQLPAGPIKISDPNNVPDLLVNGPMNIINMGALVQITFTTVRPDISDIFSGNSSPKFIGVVASRIVMPAEQASQLAQLIRDHLASVATAQPAGPIGRA